MIKSRSKYLIIVSFLAIFKAYAQRPAFELKGVLTGVDTGFVQIWASKTDTTCTVLANKVPIINGKFTFQGQLAHPSTTALVIESKEVLETGWFYIDTGKQEITILIESLVTVTSNGTTFNEYAQKFTPKMALIERKKGEWKRNYGVLANKYNLDMPPSVEDSMQIISNALNREKGLILLDYIKQNPKSYVGLMELSGSISRNNYLPIHDSCFFYMDKQLKNSLLGKRVADKLKNVQLTAINSIFPSIPLTNINGQEIIFNKDTLGAYTLVDFWFHSCGACLLQFPKFKAIYGKWQAKGFNIMGISIDKKGYEANWRAAIDKHQLSWTQYWDINSVEANRLLINFFPTNFLLDKTGKIVAKNIEPHQLEKFLEANLK
jgi:thiol-disulfide isomerase/thioredoxin